MSGPNAYHPLSRINPVAQRAWCRSCFIEVDIVWKIDRRNTLGGAWKCALRQQEANRDYRSQNREQINTHTATQAYKDIKRRWYLKNAEQVKARVAEWCKSNPDRQRESRNRRRARLLDATIEIFTRAELIQYWVENGVDPDKCIYCGGLHEHDDHVIPLSRGGTHERANLVPSCAKCNCSKYNKLPHEWRPEQFSARAEKAEPCR